MDFMSAIFNRTIIKMRMPVWGILVLRFKERSCYVKIDRISIHIHSHCYFHIQNHHYRSNTGLRWSRSGCHIRFRIRNQLLFPPKPDEPQDPPQPVAAKSLMLKPPKIYLQFIIFYGWQNVRKIHWYTFFCVCGIICNRMYEKK